MSTNWQTSPTELVKKLLPTITNDRSIRNYAAYLGIEIPLERIAELRAKHPPRKMVDYGDPIGLPKAIARRA